MLGSAPEPEIPLGLIGSATLVCINNAGAAAARLGLPPPRLTIRNSHKKWAAVAGCDMPLLLWICDRNAVEIALKRLLVRRTRIGEIHRMATAERDTLCRHMAEIVFNEADRPGKPSTAVFAALLGAFAGVPGIVISGVSLGKEGYSYPIADGRMLHSEEDRRWLQGMARRQMNVATTAADLSRQCGLPLCS